MSTVWTPEKLDIVHQDLEIRLDSAFAQRMLEVTLTSEVQDAFNRNIGQEICKKFKVSTSQPYTFIGNTAYVERFDVGAQDGKWLASEGKEGARPKITQGQDLQYSSHNFQFSSDTLCALYLFSKWVEYVEVFEDSQ
jgi:hypothetical protein